LTYILALITSKVNIKSLIFKQAKQMLITNLLHLPSLLLMSVNGALLFAALLCILLTS